jgi:hypothetical protein
VNTGLTRVILVRPVACARLDRLDGPEQTAGARLPVHAYTARTDGHVGRIPAPEVGRRLAVEEDVPPDPGTLFLDECEREIRGSASSARNLLASSAARSMLGISPSPAGRTLSSPWVSMRGPAVEEYDVPLDVHDAEDVGILVLPPSTTPPDPFPDLIS